MVQKVGLLGGTFDPIHNGHLRLAEAALRECDLQRVCFVVSAVPPHKDGGIITSFDNRVEMVKRAIEGRKQFLVSTIEASLTPPSYTIDMLRAIHSFFDKSCSFHFIIGSDAFFELSSWKDYRQVLSSVDLILALRGITMIAQVTEKIRHFGYEWIDGCWRSTDTGERKIYVLRNKLPDISSSGIREQMQRNHVLDRSVPDSVAQYIHDHGLYAYLLAR